MPPKVPVEIAKIREFRDLAWGLYDWAVDAQLPRTMIEATASLAMAAEVECRNLYQFWQKLGGKSANSLDELWKDAINLAMEIRKEWRETYESLR